VIGKKVLVTGGAGFIGSNLIRLLLARGSRVVVIDNFSAGRPDNLQGLPIDLIRGDIMDRGLLNRVVPDCDAIVHLAAQTGVPGSLADPLRDCEINVLGTLNVLEACRKSGARPFVFASSNAPLGRQEPPASEEKAPLPISPYGASKLAGEGYCLAYAGSWNIPTTALRFSNVYGPYSDHKGSVVAKFFRDLIATGRITIDGGSQTRDFIYVGDLCNAVVRALEVAPAGEVFHIGTGIETSIASLASMMQEVTGIRAQVQTGSFRQGDIQKNYSKISKAQKLLGWHPQVSLRKGLKSTWEWFQREAVPQ
jgi:UDP-glucose 4-epimerase